MKSFLKFKKIFRSSRSKNPDATSRSAASPATIPTSPTRNQAASVGGLVDSPNPIPLAAASPENVIDLNDLTKVFARIQIDKASAEASMELLNNLNSTHGTKSPAELDAETRGLLNQLFATIGEQQRALCHNITILETRAEHLSQQNNEAAQSNTELDSQIMMMLQLNDDICQCMDNHKKLWIQASAVPKKPKPPLLVDIAGASEVPGLIDSVAELEEMQQWMQKHDDQAEKKPADEHQSHPQPDLPNGQTSSGGAVNEAFDEFVASRTKASTE